MENLDLECAKLGQTLANEREISDKLLTDAVGVLEEQGLYAAFLYLEARGGKGGKAINKKVNEFLKMIPVGTLLAHGHDVLESVKELSKNLDNLLLARDLVRQVLVYARYHVKARS